MSFREMDQLHTANLLLRVTITMLYAGAALQVPVLMEHPAEPHDLPEAASSWRLAHLRHLRALPYCRATELDQCMWGALSRKPTCLFTVHMMELEQQVRARQGGGFCTHGRRHAPLLGRDGAGGGWLTAAAKTYPPQLCALIAGCVVSAARRAWPTLRTPHSLGEWLLPPELQPFWTPLDPFVEHTWGADFEGHRDDDRVVSAAAEAQLATALRGLI